jgi:hypothetical protein
MISKTTFFVIILLGLSIGVQIMIHQKRTFWLFFRKGPPLMEKVLFEKSGLEK